MAIKDFIISTIKNIEGEKARAVEIAKQKAMQERVIPHNAEVDKQFNEAVGELTDKFNKEVAELKAKYETDKQGLAELATTNKTNFQNATINAVSTQVSIEYDSVLAELEKVLEKQGE